MEQFPLIKLSFGNGHSKEVAAWLLLLVGDTRACDILSFTGKGEGKISWRTLHSVTPHLPCGTSLEGLAISFIELVFCFSNEGDSIDFN
jgi:hypothetical protein